MPVPWGWLGSGALAALQRSFGAALSFGSTDLASKVALCAATNGLGVGFLLGVGITRFVVGLKE